MTTKGRYPRGGAQRKVAAGVSGVSSDPDLPSYDLIFLNTSAGKDCRSLPSETDGDGGVKIWKRCTKCRAWKIERTGFYWQKSRRRYMRRCKDCHNFKNEEWRRNNPEKRSQITTRAARKIRFRQRYGMTPEDYEQMHEAQDGLCLICGRPERKVVNRKTVMLAVDHCHETRQVRGLLCHACNNAIGLLDDDPEIIRNAAKYIETHR